MLNGSNFDHCDCTGGRRRACHQAHRAKAIKDAYAAIKAFIQRRYQTPSVESLEHEPYSKTKLATLAENLGTTGAKNDHELLDLAKHPLDAVKTHDCAAATTLNVDFDQIEAAYFKLKNATADGSVNVGIRRAQFNGGIDMDGLAAGTPPQKP